MILHRAAIAFCASLALAATIAPQASACREYAPTEEQLAELPVIINVAVLHAERVESPDMQVWRIVAEGQREPGAPLSEFEFDAALATASCPLLPLPKPGDPWILRLTDPASTEYDTAYPQDYLQEQQAYWDAYHEVKNEDGTVTVTLLTPPPDAADTVDPQPAPPPSDQ